MPKGGDGSFTRKKVPAEYRAYFDAATAQGWTIELRSGGHFRLTAPSGARVFCGSTSGDRYSHRKVLATLKRAGLVWPVPRPT